MNIFTAVLAAVTVFSNTSWSLVEDDSALTFTSTKNEVVTETHAFTGLSGRVGSDGQVSIVIDAESVETNIPIRNKRVRDLMLMTGVYPDIRLQATYDLSGYRDLAVGEAVEESLAVIVNILDVAYPVAAMGRVTRLSETSVKVESTEPVVLDVTQLGLAPGVGALREIAGLKSISTETSVTFRFVFAAVGE